MSTPPSRKRLGQITRLIALRVYGEIDSFRSRNLSDAQMEELVPIISRSIYSVLTTLYYEQDGRGLRRTPEARAELLELVGILSHESKSLNLAESREGSLDADVGYDGDTEPIPYGFEENCVRIADN
jgi:hypothetical protein